MLAMSRAMSSKIERFPYLRTLRKLVPIQTTNTEETTMPRAEINEIEKMDRKIFKTEIGRVMELYPVFSRNIPKPMRVSNSI